MNGRTKTQESEEKNTLVLDQIGSTEDFKMIDQDQKDWEVSKIRQIEDKWKNKYARIKRTKHLGPSAQEGYKTVS